MNHLLKFIVLSVLITTSLLLQSHAQVKITTGAVLTMDANSLLELESTNKGLLIPRMAINSLSLPAPLTAPVPAGMQVYSIGGTIPDGFYFWNGTKWMAFSFSEIPVTKSATATLLKSETFVLASGNITLTLPVVTAADNGLAFTVKNIGTYTDLIVVLASGTATFDGYADPALTRWQSRTWVAWNGNWITKNKETRVDHFYDVSLHGSFTTIAEIIAFLNMHMTGPSVVRLGAGVYPLAATQTIDLPYPVTFMGLSFGETSVDAMAGVSGSPMFICITECYFKQLIFNAIANTAGNDAIRFTGSGTYHEVKDCVFNGFNRGVVSTNNNDIWLFETDFEDCAGAGVEVAAGSASGGIFRMSETDFFQCAKGVSLLSGVSATVSILNSTFYNTIAGTDIGILYTPASFTNFISLVISNTAWNNQGTYISGFDFSLSSGRDANAFLINNAGMENENPHCKINLNNNSSTTTITNSGTYYKANWASNTSVYTSKWTMGSTAPASGNRITYQPNNKRDAWAIITGDISNSTNNRTITICIVKNGITTTRYGETDLRILTANNPMQFSTVIYIPDMAKNDFLELFVTSNSSGDVVTFLDIQWFTNTQ